MASPKYEVFTLFNNSGAPLAGQTGMVFAVYQDDTGGAVAPPSIVEFGGGLYGFIPTLPASPARGLVYLLNTNGANPAYVSRYVRPEDYNPDGIPAQTATLASLLKILKNRYKIWLTGGDAFKLVMYDDDGVTPLFKFNLLDSLGAASTNPVFERVPTT